MNDDFRFKQLNDIFNGKGDIDHMIDYSDCFYAGNVVTALEKLIERKFNIPVDSILTSLMSQACFECLHKPEDEYGRRIEIVDNKIVLLEGAE
jgi:hypothetical protein